MYLMMNEGGVFFCISKYYYILKIPIEHRYFGFMGNGSIDRGHSNFASLKWLIFFYSMIEERLEW